MLDALIEAKAQGHVLRFERRIARPLEKVWAALIEPERIADWLAEAEVEPRVGGAYRLRFLHAGSSMAGVITRFEPPRLLEYSWREGEDEPSLVRWELEPDGEFCRLRLTHDFPAPGDLAGFASGWQRHLEALPGAVDGIRTQWDRDAWRTLYQAYQDLLARPPFLIQRS